MVSPCRHLADLIYRWQLSLIQAMTCWNASLVDYTIYYYCWVDCVACSPLVLLWCISRIVHLDDCPHRCDLSLSHIYVGFYSISFFVLQWLLIVPRSPLIKSRGGRRKACGRDFKWFFRRTEDRILLSLLLGYHPFPFGLSYGFCPLASPLPFFFSSLPFK